MWLKFSSGFFERNDVRDFFSSFMRTEFWFVLFCFVLFFSNLLHLIFFSFFPIFFSGGGGGSYSYFLEAEVAWPSG